MKKILNDKLRRIDIFNDKCTGNRKVKNINYNNHKNYIVLKTKIQQHKR